MAIDPARVKKWLQDEGYFQAEQPADQVVAQWGIKVPVDLQQSINMAVGIPKGKEDLLVVSLTLIPGPEPQKIFAALSDEEKQAVIRELSEEFLRFGRVYPNFGRQPEVGFVIVMSSGIYEDAPLTKDRLMSRIHRLRAAFLFYELVGNRILQRQGSGQEYLKR